MMDPIRCHACGVALNGRRRAAFGEKSKLWYHQTCIPATGERFLRRIPTAESIAKWAAHDAAKRI